MTPSLLKHRAFAMLLLLPLIVSTACLSAPGNAPRATPQPATGTAPTEIGPPAETDSTAAATPEPASTEAAEVGPDAPDEIFVEGDMVFGTGGFIFTEPAAGLAELPSYKATLTQSFVGTEAGQPSEWSRTYVMLSTQAPLARQLTVESTGLLADGAPVFMAELAGTAYTVRGDAACAASALDPESGLSLQLEPASFLTGVIGAQEAGAENVSGVETQHFTFDARALGLPETAQASGELWVAAEGGYLVRYDLVTQAGADYFGEGVEGTLTWNYVVTDVAQPQAIGLPADCPAGLVDVPALPDAADLSSEPGLLSYTTAGTPADAAAFYQEQLPTLGWQPASEPVLSDTLALLEYTRAGQQLSVIISAAEAGTTVLIVVERADA